MTGEIHKMITKGCYLVETRIGFFEFLCFVVGGIPLNDGVRKRKELYNFIGFLQFTSDVVRELIFMASSDKRFAILIKPWSTDLQES